MQLEDKISKLNKKQKQEYLEELRNIEIPIRSNLDIDKHVTFGIEIEFSKALFSTIEKGLYVLIKNKDLNNGYRSNLKNRIYGYNWRLEQDKTVSLELDNQIYGGEIKSPILCNNKENWEEIVKICNLITDNNGFADTKTGAHIHIGKQIIDNNTLTLYHLLELWVAYENIIFRFSYGEKNGPRPNMFLFTIPIYKNFFEINHDFIKSLADRNVNINDFIKALELERNTSLNLINLRDCGLEKSTIEVRVPNGTLNPIIWQNNINFFIKLFSYAKSKDFDEDLIKSRLETNRYSSLLCESFIDYNELDVEKAMELADLIFDNSEDKTYFLKQYIKDDIHNSKRLHLTKLS